MRCRRRRAGSGRRGSRWHPGDPAWSRFQHAGREPEWPTALWTGAADAVVAWGWAELPGHLDLLVDPARPELAAEVLAWFDAVAAPGPRTVTACESEPHVVEALVAAGFRERPDAPYLRQCLIDLADLPERPADHSHTRCGRDTAVVTAVTGAQRVCGGPHSRCARLPTGYRSQAADDVDQRVRVHRAAFAPSRVTVESYLAVRAAWPYRDDLDRVVVAPDGSVAAFALAWPDERTGVGLLEPVGVDPLHRGQGLARAVSLDALHALKTAGMQRAVVWPRGDGAHPVPLRVCRGLGFGPGVRTSTFVR